MSDSTPTKKLDTIDDDGKKSRTLLYVLIGIGALLLVAIIVLIATLLNGQAAPAVSASPSPSLSSPSPTPTETAASPSPTPSQVEEEEPEPQPVPEPTGARFKSFSAPSSEAGCSPGGPGFPETRPLLKVTWSTAGADEAWFVMGTSDAADSGFMQIPLNGNQSDFQYPIEFNCSNPSTTYTITLVAPDGDHVSKSWTVTNTGEQF